jgi:hypothetical protein
MPINFCGISLNRNKKCNVCRTYLVTKNGQTTICLSPLLLFLLLLLLPCAHCRAKAGLNHLARNSFLPEIQVHHLFWYSFHLKRTTMLFDNNRTTNTGGGFEPRSSAAQSMSSLHFSNSFSSGGTSRSLSQLAAANIQYSNDMTANVGPSNAGTPALLGNRPTFSGLSQQQQQPSSAQQQSNYADNGGIQESLDNHMDNILLRIVQMQQQQTKELLEERVQKRLKEDWDVSVQAWRNTLVGNRNFVDDTTEITMAAGGNKQHLMLTNGQSYGVGSQSLGLLNANGTETTQMVMDHLQIVQNMGQSTNVLQLMDNFETIATNDGYSSAWQLLKALLPNMSSPVGGALGALDFLCCQYQRVVEDRVRSASLNGHDVAAPVQYQNARANSAAAFVKLTIGSTASVWDIIYYCKYPQKAHSTNSVFIFHSSVSCPGGVRFEMRRCPCCQSSRFQYSGWNGKFCRGATRPCPHPGPTCQQARKLFLHVWFRSGAIDGSTASGCRAQLLRKDQGT